MSASDSLGQQFSDPDLVRTIKGRPVPARGQRVALYRNLNSTTNSHFPQREKFSMLGVGPQGGIGGQVLGHTNGVRVSGVEFRANRAAKAQADSSSKRGVAIFAVGDIDKYQHVDHEDLAAQGHEQATWYPGDRDRKGNPVGFWLRSPDPSRHGRVLEGADSAVIGRGKMWVPPGSAVGRKVAPNPKFPHPKN